MPDNQTIRLEAEWTAGGGEFWDIGLVALDNEHGDVDGVAPEDPDYWNAILTSPSRRTLFTDQDHVGSRHEASYPGGVQLACYVVHDNPDIGPVDDHMRMVTLTEGAWELRWEESIAIWPGTGVIGNRGFDDAVIYIQLDHRGNTPGARSHR